MSVYENENRPESAERIIQVTNCTIYVGSVGIVVDPRFNSDCTSIAKTRVTEDHDRSSEKTSPKQTDFVSARSTKPRTQRQSITTANAVRPKATKVRPTSRQKSVCQRPAMSQLPCCLHGVSQCNYEARFGAGSDNCIAGTEDGNAAARNGDPSRRNSSGRSTMWGTQNGGRLSPLRFGSQDQNVAKSDWPTPSKIPVPCLSQPKPPVRQDRPVDLYAGSRLPVPVRPGPAAARIPRIDRTADVRPSSQNEGRSGRWCVTANNLNSQKYVTVDKLPDTEDKPADTEYKLGDIEDKLDDTNVTDVTDDKLDDTNVTDVTDDKLDDTDNKLGDTDDKLDDTNVIDVTDDKLDDTDDKLDDTDDKLDDTDNKLGDTDDKLDDTNVTDDKLDDTDVTDDKLDDTNDKPDDTDDKPDDTDDKPDDTDDKPHDVVDLLDYDDTVVEPGQPCVHIDESAARATPKQGCPLQALDDRSSTMGSKPVAVESDSLSDASDHPSLKPVDQNESGMTVPTLTPVAADDDNSQLYNIHSSGHQSATVLDEILL